MEPTNWSAAFAQIVDTMSRHIGPSLLTVAMGCFLYLGYLTIQQGSLFDAVSVLITSKEERLKQDQAKRAAALQAEVIADNNTNNYIRNAMRELLDGPSGNAVRVRFGVIHNGVSTLTGVGILRADVVMGVTERGRDIGPLPQNAPLSEWQDYLGDLLLGHCKYMRADDLTVSSKKSRIEAMGITSFLVCPVRDSNGGLVGALYLSWDKEDDATGLIDMKTTTERLMNVADRVGLVYHSRPKSPNIGQGVD